jgi:hypothetical protein
MKIEDYAKPYRTPRAVTIPNFCLFYGISYRTATTLIKQGALECVKIGKTNRVIDPGWDIIRRLSHPRLMLYFLPLFGVVDIAYATGRHRSTVTGWRQQGIIKGTRFGGRLLYSALEIRAALDHVTKQKRITSLRSLNGFAKASVLARPPAGEWLKQALKAMPMLEDHPFLAWKDGKESDVSDVRKSWSAATPGGSTEGQQ